MFNRQSLESAMQFVAQIYQVMKLNNRFFELAILAFIFLIIKGNKKERLFVVFQMMLVIVLVGNPFLIQKLVVRIPLLKIEYFHVFGILMLNLLIALAVLKLAYNLTNNQQILAVIGVLWIMLLLSGVLPTRCVDIETAHSTNRQQQIYQQVVACVEASRSDDTLLLAPIEIMSASKIYSNQINVLYNKDITQIEPRTGQDLYASELDTLCEKMWSEEPDYAYIVPTAVSVGCSHIVLLKERVDSEAIKLLENEQYKKVEDIDAYVIYQRKRIS